MCPVLQQKKLLHTYVLSAHFNLHFWSIVNPRQATARTTLPRPPSTSQF